jgi:biotin carboxyl carrier protein
MPGTILDIKVAVGDTVASGQAICVLEAMKMENDVNAPCAGKVLSINTTKGSAVETGAVLAVIG